MDISPKVNYCKDNIYHTPIIIAYENINLKKIHGSNNLNHFE